MKEAPAEKPYFTKHLFGAGVECPTKLFYYAKNYPENKQSAPFIRHAVFNKRLLKSLVRSVYPGGITINGKSIPEAASQTAEYLEAEQVVLFNAIFEYEQMMARLPLIVRDGDRLTVFHVQAKAFDSRKHQLSDRHNRILGKWRDYLLDFAYQLYLIQQNRPDLELQAYLVLPEKSGMAITNDLPSKLMSLSRLSDFDIDLANQQLLAKLEVTQLIQQIWYETEFAEEHFPERGFEETLFYLRDLFLDSNKVDSEVGLKCRNCEFRVENKRIEQGTKSGFNECWSPVMQTENSSELHLFDLIGSGTNQWIERGVYDQRKINLDNIFDIESIVKGQGRISHEMRQALQLHKVQGEEIPDEIFRPELFRELKRWQYPLHFLDFEAGNYAVPVRKHHRPYDLVIFQFSCHTLHEDGSLEHYQWIDDLQSGYSNYELVRQLSKVPHIKEGTIIQYSDFERHALKTIRRELQEEEEQIPDAEALIEWIEDIIHRHDSTHHEPPYVADLSRQVKDFYYNREMGNSLSIKDVLSSVMSYSDLLKQVYSEPYSSHNFDNIIWWQDNGRDGARNPYTILTETGDSPIRRGTEAMVVYGKLITQSLSEEELKAYRDALLKYCELDTLAMLMIYQHWQEALDEVE